VRNKIALATPQLIFICLFLVLLSVSEIHASENIKCYVIKVDGTVDMGYADIIERILSNPPENLERVIIILNTNGGYLVATEKIVDCFINSIVPVTVFIPKGGRAFSAGAYIALAADELIMSPASTIGSAEPRTMIGESDPKVTNAMAKWIKAIAEDRGRNSTIAELMVIKNLDLTGGEAYKYGIANKLMDSINEVLEYYGYDSDEIKEVNKDFRAVFISIITDPIIVGLLIDLAAIIIVIEIMHPTYIGGLVAVLIIIFALVGLGLLGVNAAALILLLIGAISIILEVKYAHGGLGVGGAILTLIGILLIYQHEYFLWSWDLKTMLIGFSAIIITVAGLTGVYLHKIREVLMKKEKLHDISRLIGKVGVAKTEIKPGERGVVLVESDLWTAESDEYIPVGSKIEVLSINGLVVKVRKITNKELASLD